jgi:hypothetical protein
VLGSALARPGAARNVNVPRKSVPHFRCALIRKVDLVLGLVQGERHGRVGRVTGEIIDQNILGLGSHRAKTSKAQAGCQLTRTP